MADGSSGMNAGGGASSMLSPQGQPLQLTHQRQLSVQDQPRSSEHHGSITVKPITAISGRPPPGGTQLIPTSSGQSSPTKRIASQILEIDQTQQHGGAKSSFPIQTLGTTVNEVMAMPIQKPPVLIKSHISSPQGADSGQPQQTLIARDAVNFNPQPMRLGEASSHYSETVVAAPLATASSIEHKRGPGVLSSIESQSVNGSDLLIPGQEIKIPGLTDLNSANKKFGNMLIHGASREDSFDVSSPGHHSSNGAYYNACHILETAANPLAIHNRAASSAQGKQHLMDTGAKVTGIADTASQQQNSALPTSPKTVQKPPTFQLASQSKSGQTSAQSSLVRVRNESLSSAGRVIGSSQLAPVSGTADRHFKIQAIGLSDGSSGAKPQEMEHYLGRMAMASHGGVSAAISGGPTGSRAHPSTRNPTNESVQSIIQLPGADMRIANHQSAQGQPMPIRLKNVASSMNQSLSGSIAKSGQGTREQTAQGITHGSSNSVPPPSGNLTQMSSQQYAAANGLPPSGQNVTPHKRTSMGVQGSANLLTLSNANANSQNHNNQLVNAKKGSLRSGMSPLGKQPLGAQGSMPIQMVQHQTVQGFGLSTATSNKEMVVSQQRQFGNPQLPSSRQQNNLFASSTAAAGATSTHAMLQQQHTVSSQRVTQPPTQPLSGIMSVGTVHGFMGQKTIYAGGGASAQTLTGPNAGGHFNSKGKGAAAGAVGSAAHQTQQFKNQSASQGSSNNKAMKPGGDAGGSGAPLGPNKQPNQVISRTNPVQGQNSFRGPVAKPSPLKSQGATGIMGSRQGMGALGVTPSSNIHQPNNLGAANGILGSNQLAQQQMNPLFKMGQGMAPGAGAGSVGHGHHAGMAMQGQVIGNSANTSANITGLSHPSTATHQNATHEHLNSTVGSHSKTTADTNANKDMNGQPHGVAGATVANAGTGANPLGFGNESGFKMFERENFKFKDSIMIHVIDDSKNEKRDFTFSRSLLVKYMKYFDRCLKKISDNDEIDISIHCDAVIFEWLLNYIFAMEEYEKKQSDQEKFNRAVGNSVGNSWQLKVNKCNENGEKEEKTNFANSAIMLYNGPKLDIKNAVTILIPAEFLKIDRLVRECLDFIGEHIEEISRVQVDMSCINTNIIREMAKKVSLDRLDLLKERKDKIVSRLFMKKLELLLEKEKNHLYKCAYCNKLFTKKQRKVLSCRKGTSFIDANGQMRAKHVVDKNWDLKKFVTFVRETYRISWKEIYWKVWSYLHLLKCDRCMEFYPIAEMGYCRSHTAPPKVKMSGSPYGTQYEYGCCSEQVSVYQVLNGQKGDNGCLTQLHEARHIYNVTKAKEKKIIDRIIAHQLIILENPTGSFIETIRLEEKNKSGNSKEGTGIAVTVSETNQNQSPMIVRPSSLNYKISLIEAVKNFIAKERCGPDQQIEVELEEPSQKKMAHFEVLDDALFNLQYVPKYNKDKSGSAIAKNKRDSSHRFENQWEREEEQIRKKLEKNSINLMKSKIAQQAKAEQSSNQQVDQDQQAQAAGAIPSQQPTQSTTVQLSQNQIEEAKQMTQGKLKMYRRDRLYTSDKDRLQNLHDSLKNVRIVDEASYFNSQPENGGSPTKGGRNRDGAPPLHKGGVGSKGDRGGPGGPSSGAGAAGGGGSSGYGYSKGGIGNGAGDKGGSAAAKGTTDYTSHAGRHRNAGMGAAAQAMQDAMAKMSGAADRKVLTGLNDIMDKRSNSKSKAKPNSPAKQNILAPGPSPQQNSKLTNQNGVLRSSSPGKMNTLDGAKARGSSPRNVNQSGARTSSRQATSTFNSTAEGARNGAHPPRSTSFQSNPQPYVAGKEETGGMNSLLKSPIKNNLQQVQFSRPGATGSAKMHIKNSNSQKLAGVVLTGSSAVSSKAANAIVVDHSLASVVAPVPSAFV